MGWNTIRRATQADHNNIEAAAERFCRRHGIRFDPDGIDGVNASFAVECEISNPDTNDRTYLEKLWRRVVRYQMSEPAADGIAYDYVGYSDK